MESLAPSWEISKTCHMGIYIYIYFSCFKLFIQLERQTTFLNLHDSKKQMHVLSYTISQNTAYVQLNTASLD